MRRHGIGVLLAGLAWVGAVPAASQMPMTPVDHDFVRAVYERWYLPGARSFGTEAVALRNAVQALCAAPPADAAQALAATRTQWQATVAQWERFSAVRGGALLARRSPREIDFMPTRPESIKRAIELAPDAAAMERVGAPAKGLPALEWLLWTQPVRAGEPACRYAVQVANGVALEADALRAAFARSVQSGWDDEETEYALYEFLNLFDAGVQKLWWEDMDRPRHRAAAGARAAGFPRTASGGTVAAWRAHWEGLRALAVGAPGRADAPSLQAYLLRKGHPVEAGALQPRVTRVDRAFDALAQGDAAAAAPLAEAVAALKDLQHYIEGDAANALQFVISFFDEDGD